MATIIQMERRLQAWGIRVAVLCVLFGLWSFIPLAGAKMTETFGEREGMIAKEMMAAPAATDSIVVAQPAGNVLEVAVTPDMGPEAKAADAVAPLPGSLVLAQGNPPPDQPQPPLRRPPKPKPKPRPTSPVR